MDLYSVDDKSVSILGYAMLDIDMIHTFRGAGVIYSEKRSARA